MATYGGGDEDDAGAGEEVLVVEALPQRVSPALRIGVQAHLEHFVRQLNGSLSMSRAAHLIVEPALLLKL